MKRSFPVAFGFAFWCAFALGASAQGPNPAPEEQTGIKIGEKAPAFALKDQTGKEVTLEALLKEGPVALVFTRSADW